MKNIDSLQPWDKLLKKILFQQFEDISAKRILDFGSGDGITANFFAEKNDVTAIEPSEDMLRDRCAINSYRQIIGSLEQLKQFNNGTFDYIVCHNVLEYVDEKAKYINEFNRILKKEGMISIVKHNRAGRVMQNVVLLNNFDHAKELLSGKNSKASKFGIIKYYEDFDIEKWCPELKIQEIRGIRTFWDLQQNQDNHKDPDWQEKMIEIECMVGSIPEYKAIAFFHHIILEKRK